MPPTLALLIYASFILALLVFDPAKVSRSSHALWVPGMWFFIIASRLPSQWLGGSLGGRAAASMEQGDALDRTIYSILILIAVGILVSRSFDWRRYFAANLALTAVLSFSLLSVLWSDFPFVSIKRWIRDLGIYLVILVVLSDEHPFEAVRTLLRRLFFVLIPLSILFNKYYPDLARDFDPWTGQGYVMGVTTGKNMLGVLCLVSGLYFLWDTLTRWGDRAQPRRKWTIAVNLLLLAMTISLLSDAGSATSSVCLILGSLLIAAAHLKTIKRHPAILLIALPIAIGVYLVLEFGFDINTVEVLSEAVGRSPDLTGRTNIWSAVLSIGTNPYVGTGYESFWLGPRLEQVWDLAGSVNEAHNGYLETYLNLGAIGLFLLAVFLIASYRTICKRFMASSGLGSLGLALWAVLLFFNVTESAFSGQLLTIVFLMEVIVVPGRARQPSAQEQLPNKRVPKVRKHVTA